jgi:dTDP-4-amino-4,6-dideoxygalactose transaminase
MKVPQFDAKLQFELLKSELLETVERVLASGGYILGIEVEAFEREIAQYLGVDHAVGVASGTDALWLALKSVGIGPSDYVLTTPFTFFATASAILNTGAQPIFADIDPRTYNIDPDEVKAVMEGRSQVYLRLGIDPGRIKAIIPVHLYGQPAEMNALIELARQFGVFVIEDAAQALGADYIGEKVGGLGHLGCFSFFPTKNLGAFGDGGLVCTNNGNLAERLRMLRVHGLREKYHHKLIGTNSRLDALQAALLRVKLSYLDEWIQARRRHAIAYDFAFHDVPGIVTPFGAQGRHHAYHQYTVRVIGGRRDALHGFLKELGIGTAIYYPVPVHLQSALHYLGHRQGDFPGAETACLEALSLPIYPELTEAHREEVIHTIREFLK